MSALAQFSKSEAGNASMVCAIIAGVLFVVAVSVLSDIGARMSVTFVDLKDLF